ncbi:NACHT domain-containing protein [Nostoc sp. CALU 546]|uniref:NACHT domain-containing protein n=1 Tax=Nostoc sp. CALU 546 TaxID=1867241 RepID=UPI003B67DBE1
MRSLIHDDIQRLHSTMPLWGVDHWVPLGDLFVDVNILEQVSSSRRSELDDLWQDFITGNSDYHSLERIGLGKKQQGASALALLESNTNLMVVGKPGSGKTTYLQKIVTECNDGKLQARRIPALIKLREFVDDGRKYAYNLEPFLGQFWRLGNAEIELVLSQGKGLVLLDGLDEVAGEAGKQIAKEIKRFARIYPQVLMVVTCRTQTLPDFFDWQSQRFICIEVADFNEAQVRAFAAHWFGTVCADAGETKTQEFLEQLFQEENKPTKELGITPILLSLICAVFHQTGKFYSQRSKLYQECLELLLEQWDERRGIERDEIYRGLLVAQKLELLSYVAVKKFEQQQYVLFKQEELEVYIGEFLGINLQNSQEVLQVITSQHGLLIERSHKIWSFSHLTFQEYLVANWFYKHGDWEELASYITQENWRQVFLLVIQIVPNPDYLLQIMKSKIDALVLKDKEIQTFLMWVNHKSSSVFIKALSKDLFKFPLIRAFYSYLGSKVASKLDWTLSDKIDLDDEYMETEIELDTDMLAALEDSWIIVYAMSSNLQNINYRFRNLTDNNSFVHTFDVDLNELTKMINRAIARAIARSIYCELNPEFYQVLQILQYKLPNSESSCETLSYWWKLNGEDWFIKLKGETIKYRNIGFNSMSAFVR